MTPEVNLKPVIDPDLLNAGYSVLKPRGKSHPNKIAFQPEDADWNIDRLGELDAWHRTKFGKPLPLTNRGQGSVHNKMGWDHRESGDISVNPTTPEGQSIMAEMRARKMPFLAFTGPVPGASTGPHIHGGRPSHRTAIKYPVGSQVKSKRHASSAGIDSDLLKAGYGEEASEPTPTAQTGQPTIDPELLSIGMGKHTANAFVPPKQSITSALDTLTRDVNRRVSRIKSAPTGNSIYETARQRARTGTTSRQPTSDPFALLKSINAQPALASPDDALREQAVRNVTSFTVDPIANVKSLIGAVRKGTQAQVDTEAEEEFQRLKAAEGRARTPEMIAARKEYGAMTPLPGQVNPRAVIQPLAKTSAGLLKLVGGITSLAGLTENDFSKWANARGHFIEEAASLAPLNAAGDEIKRGLPEKVVGALEETGLSIAEIILLKKSTGMPLGRLLALETALKSSDEPMDKRAAKVAESYAMGRVLESHLSRPASALLFGGPTAAREGQAYLNDDVSLEDAILQTAVQTGVGAAMGGKPKGERNVRSNRISGRLDTRDNARGEVGELGNIANIQEVRNARQTEMQRQGVQTEESAQQETPAMGNERSDVGSSLEKPSADTARLSSTNDVTPQRFQHLQFGEVEVTESQQGARPGRLRVAEVGNPESIHYVKKADRQGRGNAQLLPIKPAEQATEPLPVEGQRSIRPSPPQNQRSVKPRLQVNEEQPSQLSPTESRETSAPLTREDVHISGTLERPLEPTVSFRLSQKEVHGAHKVEVESLAMTKKRAGQPTPLAENAPAPQGNAPYRTGQPVTIPFTRNTEGAAQYAPGGKYNEVVPGKYMVERPEGYKAPDARWEQGDVTFNNPLVIETRSDSPSDPTHWKNVLSKQYGKTGKALSDALRREGYDGVISYDKYGTQEIVDLLSSKSLAARNEAVSSTEQPSSSKVASPETLTTERSLAPETKSVVQKGEPQLASTTSETERISRAETSGAVSGGSAAPSQTDLAQIAVPERPETLRLQMEQVNQAKRPAVLFTEGEEILPHRKGLSKIETPVGTWVFNPHQLSAKEIKARVADGTFGELLGHVAPKPGPGEPVSVAVARDAQGREIQSSSVPPGRATEQAAAFAKQYPGAKIETGGPELAERVLGERQPSTTSAKNASMATAREALELPELSRPVRRKDIDVFSAAREANKADRTEASRIADKVLNGRHTLTDLDTAKIDVRAQEIQNQHKQLMREIAKATDPDVISAKGADADALKNEFDQLSRATDTGGSELARAMRIRRRTIDQDYELLPMLARAKKAKGRELNPEERLKIETQAVEIETLTKKLADAEGRAKAASIQKELDKVKRQRKRSETKEVLDSEFAELKTLFIQARAELPRVHSSGLASLDPEGTLTKLIAQMAKNRAKAGLNSAEALVTEVYSTVKDHVEGITKEDVASIIRSTLSQSDDVLSRWDKRRQSQLVKQQSELDRRVSERDFSPKPEREAPIYNRETYQLQKAVNELKSQYERDLYRATRGVTGKIADTASGVGNLPKTMLSMADFSALLRQGGYNAVTHPVLSTKAAVDMLKSMSGRGWANIEAQIKAHPLFEEAKRNGVEFTGVDKDNPNLSKREEGYLGSDVIDTIARGKANPLRLLKGVKDVSERTFVSFLDSQRIRVYSQQATLIKGMELTRAETSAALKAQAKLINIATGRGSLGEKGNQVAPLLNVAMFSPRLLASRIQLLNKMFNPVAWANTPRGSRKLMMIDNAKFLGFTLTTLGLAKAAGLGVNLDWDDADFLKIKVGDTRYDFLTGLVQPLRFFLRMASAVKADITGDESYAGETKGKMAMDFARSKASPSAGIVWDYGEGKNRLSGEKFNAARSARDAVIPLPIQEFRDAIKHDGVLRGIVETLPSLVGVGVQTYKGAAEKPTTHAEKLARRMIIRRMPDTARDEEEMEKSRKVSDLRARSRRGEDVTVELNAFRPTDRQRKTIMDAKGKTRLQEDVARLSIEDAILVYRSATRAERDSIRAILQQKSTKVDEMPEERQVNVKKSLEAIGMKPGQVAPRPREAQQPRKVRQSPNQGYVFR